MAHKSQHHLLQGRLPKHEVAASHSGRRLASNGSLVPELGACSFWQVCQQAEAV